MTAVIVGLLICLVLSAVVMALVAIPARRDGREILTARGERVVVKVRERTDNASTRASEAVAQATPTRRSTPPSNRKAS
ncbi:hypothetical protein O9K63_01330 [Janibacter cremeus]|uniref:hypothetical protein n=1 Tax=Janibacter cremeus TaxID=1285192 RepID=UPI0023F7F22E|nr:hypothetical protein [Janibacter cremeus]WEV78463.1 hypothetical protein O9K63_01330 [Janibacter cremeus]